MNNKYNVLEMLTNMEKHKITNQNQHEYVSLTLEHLERFYMEALILGDDHTYMYNVKRLYLEEIKTLINTICKIKDYDVCSFMTVCNIKSECEMELVELRRSIGQYV